MNQALVDTPLDESLVAINVSELAKLIDDAEKFEKLFYELLTVAIRAYANVLNAHPDDRIKHTIDPIRACVHDRYIEIREELPREIKQLYLKEIAFRAT